MSGESDWAVFPGQVDGKPAMLRVDLAWRDRLPDPTRPTVIRVTVRTEHARPDGFPDERGSRVLAAIEDTVVPVLEREAAAVHVGVLTQPGTREWTFYGRPEKELKAALGAALAAHTSAQPRLDLDEDPEWSYYVDVLFPDVYQYSIAQDGQVVQALNEHGDSGESAREIVHWAYFPDAGARDRFIEHVRCAGYAIGEQTEADGQYGLRFTHVGPATLDALPERTAALRQAAGELGGAYDGWECEVRVGG